MFELQEDIYPCSPQTPLPVPRSILRIIGVRHLFQEITVRIVLFKNYYTRIRLKECNSQSSGSSLCRCPFVTMSETDVRNNESKSFGSTNMIVHQCMANIFHQTVNFLRILGVAEKAREITPGCHQAHSLANLLQFPGDPACQPSSRPRRVWAYRSSSFSLSRSLMSPGTAGSRSESESVLIRGANDSTAFSFTSVF